MRLARLLLAAGEPRFHRAALPHRTFQSQLPQDPYYRLFWQAKDKEILKPKGGGLPFNVPKTSNAVADFINQINTGQEARKRFIITKFTKVTRGIAQVLHQHGMISGFRDYGDKYALVVELKYHEDVGVIQRIEQVSKQTRRVYWTPYQMLPWIPKSGTFAPELLVIRHEELGVMSAADAFARRLSGEVLCRAW
eukprot:EG_transcript_24975